MRITNCTWEMRNLGCNAAEVTIDRGETFDGKALDEVETDHDYVVVKVPIAQGAIYMSLAERGYAFIENQITFEKRYDDFEVTDRMYRHLLEHTEVEQVSDEGEFQSLLTRITPDMFTTDRIFIDPYFGAEYTVRRYRNWLTDMFRHGGYRVYWVKFQGQPVGFSVSRVSDKGILEVPLGGCFTDCKIIGIGACALLANYRLKADGLKFKKYMAKVSSNNMPMIRVYNTLNFNQAHYEYVFIKHKKNTKSSDWLQA